MEKIHRVRASTYRFNVKYFVERVEGMPNSKMYEYTVIGRRHKEQYETHPALIPSDGAIEVEEHCGEKACFRLLCKFYYVDGWAQKKYMQIVVKQIPRSKAAIAAGDVAAEVGNVWMDMGELRKHFQLKLECDNGGSSAVVVHIRAEYQCMEIGDKLEEATMNILKHVGEKDKQEEAQLEERKERQRSLSIAPAEGLMPESSQDEYAPPEESELKIARERYQELLGSYKHIPPKYRKENDVAGRLKDIEGVMLKVDSVSILREYMQEMDRVEGMVRKAQQEAIARKHEDEEEGGGHQQHHHVRGTAKKRSATEPVMQKHVGPSNGGGALVPASQGVKKKSLQQEKEELAEEIRWINFREERGETPCEGCSIM